METYWCVIICIVAAIAVIVVAWPMIKLADMLSDEEIAKFVRELDENDRF